MKKDILVVGAAVGAAWHQMVANIKASPTFWGQVCASERGAVDIGGILIMGIGMVFLAVGFIIYPIVMSATDDLLAYAGTGYNVSATVSCNSTYFTGFNAIVGITPLLVLIGYLSAAVFAMYLGVRIIKGEGKAAKLDLGSMLLLGISLIFIAIGLIILPVALDGICTVFHNEGDFLSSAYVGLGPILRITPLLILISFVAGAVVSGFFGLKRLGAGD